LVRLDPSGCPAAFRDELLAFPDSAHDDMVDAASYAFAALGADIAYQYERIAPRRWVSSQPGSCKWSSF
jgi:hypothetical protein